MAGGVRGLRGIMEYRVSGDIAVGSGVGGVRGPAGCRGIGELAGGVEGIGGHQGVRGVTRV